MTRAIRIVGIFILMAATVFGGDIYLKQKQITGAHQVMGKNLPAEEKITSMWISSNKARHDTGDKSVLVRMDKKKQYMINHIEKTYTEIPLDFAEKMVDKMAGENPDQAAQMQKMMQSMMKVEVTVTATGERKKIGRYQCAKYMQTVKMMMGTMTSEIWATTDIRIDYEQYAEHMAAIAGNMPGMQSAMEDMVKEMKKVKGVPVLTISTNALMNQNFETRTELIEFKESKAPAGTFNLPAGYKKTEAKSGMPF